MFEWLRRLIQREVVDVAPAEIDMCLDCRRLECSEGEFQTCAARKARAADIDRARRGPPGEGL